MITGIINLKKEAGMTSHDAVFRLRRLLREKKIGHGGTLDPDVVGVLPIAVGKATRVLEYMTDSGKVYEGEVTLGFSTTTEDSSGVLVAKTPVSKELSEAEVDEAIASLLGDITQIPPMYSAVKVNGKKLYEYARAGQTVERVDQLRERSDIHADELQKIGRAVVHVRHRVRGEGRDLERGELAEQQDGQQHGKNSGCVFVGCHLQITSCLCL